MWLNRSRPGYGMRMRDNMGDSSGVSSYTGGSSEAGSGNSCHIAGYNPSAAAATTAPAGVRSHGGSTSANGARMMQQRRNYGINSGYTSESRHVPHQFGFNGECVCVCVCVCLGTCVTVSASRRYV